MDYPYNFIDNTIINPVEVMANFLAIKTSDSLKASIAQVDNLEILLTNKINELIERLSNEMDLTGWIFPYGGMSEPPHSLCCNGDEISRVTYKNLFEKIGTDNGVGDGVSTFNIPNIQGVVIRGLDNGRGLDVNRVWGSYQADALQSHTHTYIAPNTQHMPRGDDRTNCVTYTLSPETSAPNNCRVANETRVKSIALNYYIRY